MKRFASELEFISRIKRDGSGVEEISDERNKELQSGRHTDRELNMTCLSITEKTWIASGFNSYVVRLKNHPKFR